MADFISCNCLCPGRDWERVHNYGLLSCTSKVNTSEDKMTCGVTYRCHIFRGRHVALCRDQLRGLPHSELLLKSGPLICIKFVFETLSPKQTVFMQYGRPHLFTHANQKHLFSTHMQLFHYPQNAGVQVCSPWLFKTHWVVYWHFYSKATLIIHIMPWGTSGGTVVN